eukprot:1291156-Amphidinium_carterae.1
MATKRRGPKQNWVGRQSTPWNLKERSGVNFGCGTSLSIDDIGEGLSPLLRLPIHDRVQQVAWSAGDPNCVALQRWPCAGA